MCKKIFYIVISLLVGTMVVTVLYILSGTPNTYKNGFNRTIKPDYLISFHSEDLKLENYKIAGASSNQIFLFHTSDPVDFTMTNFELNIKKSIPWKFPVRSGSNMITYQINFPKLDIYDRRLSVVSTYAFMNENPEKESDDSIPGKQFDLGVRLSNSSLIVRTENKILNRYTLSKISKAGTIFKENDRVLKKQVDGYLCTDGQLRYDSSLHKIIYVYYYRNQYIMLDSNLNLLRISRTIDTVSKAKIQVHFFEKEKLTTLDYPTVPINKKARVFDGRLYIQSGLLADNEDRIMFSNNSIVDVYDLHDGRYLFSFYVPHYNEYQLDDFQVYDTIIIAIQGHFVVSYLIPTH